MKALLIYPNQPKVATKPPLGLMYIASILRQSGHEPKIIEGDYQAIKKQFEKMKPFNYFPDFIGITCMTSQYHEILKIRDYFHQWDIPLIFGGPHASILPETLLTREEHFIDFVVVGEGEKIILQIMDDLCNNRIVPHDHIIQGEPVENLDTLPLPARDLVSKRYFKNGRTSILASRGCPFNCSFCQPTLRKTFSDKVRHRSVDNVIAEMLHCHRKFDLTTFEFFDDTFTSDKNWVYDFCDKLEPYWFFNLEILSRVDMVDHDLLKRLKEVGLKRISLGIESGSQEVLNSYGKGTTIEQNLEAVKMCNKLKIKVHGFFMLGALNETKESIEATKQFLKQVDFHTIFVHITMPMPCTRLYEQAKEQNRLNGDWPDFDYLGNMTTTVTPTASTLPMKIEGLSDRDIMQARYDLLRSFYMKKMRNPLYLLDFIRQNGLSYSWNAGKQVLWRNKN